MIGETNAAPVQPDLFGEYDAEQERQAQKRRAREEWVRHFDHVQITIAYVSSGGNKPGDLMEGIVCPACGGIEFNGSLLGTNHGWNPDAPELDSLYGLPAFQTCAKLQHLDAGRTDINRDGIGVVRLQKDPAPHRSTSGDQ